MTQQEKDLLLKDLCARLPYGVKVNIGATNPDMFDNYVPSTVDATLMGIDLNTLRCKFKEFWWDKYVTVVRPYLRPISSMTEEEKEDLVEKHIKVVFRKSDGDIDQTAVDIDGFDWLNKKMFDYRGLIEKGLSLEAKEGMYNNEMEE